MSIADTTSDFARVAADGISDLVHDHGLVGSASVEPLVHSDVPRVLRKWTADDVNSIFGSFVGSFGLVWLVFYNLLPFSGALGFVICWWIAFVSMYAGVCALTHSRPTVLDRMVAVVVASGAAVVAFALGSAILFTFFRGWPALHHWNFFTKDMFGVNGATAPLTKGGIKHAIVGSAIQIGIATAISLPLGVGTAIYLTEVGGKAARWVRIVVEAMTALPDILAGLFIYTFFIIELHWDRTGLAVSFALSVTMIPIIARSAEVVLRVVPGGLREAGMALGASRWQTVWRVVLPTARSGLATSLILGIARIAGETAPLLIVSGETVSFNTDPLHRSMNSLPLYVWQAVRSGQPLFIQRGYAAAALLLLFVLILFVTTRFLARDRSARR